jgi:RNA polymerase sigma-70 factor (ECF subfamily)
MPSFIDVWRRPPQNRRSVGLRVPATSSTYVFRTFRRLASPRTDISSSFATVSWRGFAFFASAVDFLGAARAEQEVEQVSDEELARRMNTGDGRAFEVLYERYFKKIYAFVVRRVGHAQIAEDLVSDVFLKAFAHRFSFTWRTSFSAWIYRIATNRVTDHYRTKRPTDELDEQHQEAPGPLSLPHDADLSILGRELENVVEKLNERERLAVTMKFYAECTNEEIAKALKITANHAGVILHRALKKCEQFASERLKALL